VLLPLQLPDAQPPRESPDLDGITCIVQRSPDYDSNRVCAWLTRARAKTVVVDDAAQLDAAIQRTRTPILVVRANADQAPALTGFAIAADAGDAAMPAIAELQIVPGVVGPIRLAHGHAVAIGAEGLRRQPLNDAALLATGRSTADAAPVQQTAVKRDATPVTVAQARKEGRMILVAEDDEINQKVILRQLGLLGYVAEIASDGREALELWRSNYYALLLTDLHMPEMDGYELAGTIRREEAAGARLPIIALTANAIQGEATRARAVGMDGYLTKPLQLNRLQCVLEQHFRLRSQPHAQDTPPSQAAASRAERPVDIDVLKSIVGDDADAVRELLGDYLASVQVLAPELRAYCVKGLGREAGAIAHKMKSSSRSVGAVELGNLCAELENAGKAGDLQTLASWVGKFDDALAAVEQTIRRLLDTHEPDSF
jgi:CheY-like chemotaxis protein